MNSDELRTALPVLLPKAVSWAEDHAALIARDGRLLNSSEEEIARRVGVLHPERVRILEVQELPLPDDIELREAALALGLLGPTMVGLTLGYSIYLMPGHRDRFLPHELRHVFQYEQAESIAEYLPKYLGQLVSFGYTDAPMEIDARKYENLA